MGDTIVWGLTSTNDEPHDREEVLNLKRGGKKPPPDHQQDQDHSELKKVQKDWTGYHLKHQVSPDLSWSVNATQAEADWTQPLTNFYGATERIPWLGVTARSSSCTAQHENDWTQVVKTAQGALGLPSTRPGLGSRYPRPQESPDALRQIPPTRQHTACTASIRKAVEADWGTASSTELGKR